MHSFLIRYWGSRSEIWLERVSLLDELLPSFSTRSQRTFARNKTSPRRKAMKSLTCGKIGDYIQLLRAIN